MKCFRCGEEAVLQVGKEKTPLCLCHFEKFMEGFGLMLKQLNKALSVVQMDRT